MTNWTQLHSDVAITTGDGFSFILLDEPGHNWNDEVYTIDEEEFIQQCLPNNKPKLIGGVEVKMKCKDALRMYLCASMSTTFALGHYVANGRPRFIIGSRSERDLFKITLKFPETKATKTWTSMIKFYIRVAEGDYFSERGDLPRGKAQYSRIDEAW